MLKYYKGYNDKERDHLQAKILFFANYATEDMFHLYDLDVHQCRDAWLTFHAFVYCMYICMHLSHFSLDTNIHKSKHITQKLNNEVNLTISPERTVQQMSLKSIF